jgi:hypothetical protein
MQIEDFFSGKAKESLYKIAEVLEVDSLMPIWPVMIGCFRRALVKYAGNERFRTLALVDQKTNEYIPVLDLEEARVKAKKLEMGQE